MLKKVDYNLGSPFCCVEFLESSCDLDETCKAKLKRLVYSLCGAKLKRLECVRDEVDILQ
jgi:hypothetical protein